MSKRSSNMNNTAENGTHVKKGSGEEAAEMYIKNCKLLDLDVDPGVVISLRTRQLYRIEYILKDKYSPNYFHDK